MADPVFVERPEAGLWRLIPAILAALATIWFAGFIGPVSQGLTPELVVPWVPALGVEAAFRLDGLALAFALLISGIGSLCFLYAATYFRSDRRLGSLLIILVTFALAMLGLVTADDAVTLFIFWEATTITSWLLVGFDHERAKARGAALQALMITGAGGLALFAGLLVMGGIAGTWRLSAMTAAGDIFRVDPLYPVVFALVALGALTKSAQFPFQFWLPGAMAAPTPVSAYLHSATMVKAGVYLLARLTPALGGTDLWTAVLTPIGAVTMLIGAVWSLRQTDMKLLLAHSTVMGLGAMVMLLGVSTPLSIAAAMTFLLVHAFYKAGLFLSVGLIERGAGSREYPQVSGLARAMPLTAAVVAFAALSMAGAPPFLGFIGKEIIYKSTEYAPWLVAVAALIANALMVACGCILALRPFLGTGPRCPKDHPADPALGLWLGPVILATLGLAYGLFPHGLETALVAPMVRAAGGGEMPIHLELWHGVNRALLLSLLTFALGGAIYWAADRLRDGLIAAEPRLPRMERGYEIALGGLLRLAGGVTALLQTGRMTRYLRLTFLVFALLLWGAILTGSASWPAADPGVSLIDGAILVIIAASIVTVLRTRSRMVAICALGGVGSGIAVIFVLYGAIDVAMTQLFVEILVVVFLAIAMIRLPRLGAIRFRAVNAVIAGALGIGATLAVLAVLGTPLDPALTRYFEAQSVPTAFGHNIVNVILVDFRGFDTMGEVSVIVIAGVAAIAALRAGRKPVP